MRSSEERREEERRYRGDVVYEVWRSGGNSDAVDYDRLSDYHADGLDSHDAAFRELRLQQPRPPMEEQYPETEEQEEVKP